MSAVDDALEQLTAAVRYDTLRETGAIIDRPHHIFGDLDLGPGHPQWVINGSSVAVATDYDVERQHDDIVIAAWTATPASPAEIKAALEEAPF